MFSTLPRLASAAAILSLGLLLASSPAVLPAAEARTIGALGRIQPAGGVIELGASAGETIDAVLVTAGTKVVAGQPLARFADRGFSDLDLRMAQNALRETEETNPLSLRSRELALRQATSNHALAKERLERYAALAESAISPPELEQRKQQAEAASNQLEEAKAALAGTLSRNATALERATIQLSVAQKRSAALTLVSPIAGTVLEVSGSSGARTGAFNIKLADTSRMIVLAEVFEGELGRLRIGAPCEVKHDAFGEAPLPGRVTQVGRIVSGSGKVAQVWVELDKPEPADRFIGMEVNVTIKP
jgi:HlyD family secretion protein